MADLEKYKSEQDRFLDERQTDEAYAKSRQERARTQGEEAYRRVL